MRKKRLTEADLLKDLNEDTPHWDELAGSFTQTEFGESDSLRSIDEDMQALQDAGLKTPDWDRFKSR